MHKITPRQQEILDLIRCYIAERGMPPTRTEIARTLGFRSINAAEDHLKALERKGFIALMAGVSRGIRLLEGTEVAGVGLPLVGRVAAGAPILAQENIEGYYRLDKELFQPRPDYLLRVDGMSMRDAGIRDGDLLVVHKTPTARNGQIVVARVEEEVTVKRFERCEGRIQLVPENPEFEPIDMDPRRQTLAIEGIAVGVIRRRLL